MIRDFHISHIFFERCRNFFTYHSSCPVSDRRVNKVMAISMASLDGNKTTALAHFT